MKIIRALDQKHLITAIQIFVGLILLVPLVTNSTFYFPFVAPKNFYFRILVELMLFTYLVLVLHNPTYLPKKQIVLKLFFGFVGLMTMASIFGTNPAYSFWSNFERMDGLITLYHLAAFLVVIYGAFKNRIDFERVIQTSVFISFVVSLIGIGQLFGVNILLESSGGERITSTLGNATYLAAYLSIHLFFAIYLMIRHREGPSLKLYAYLLIALDVVLVYFQVRYGFDTGAVGIIQQIFSHGAVLIPFLLVHVLGIGYFWLKKKDWYTKYADYVIYGITLLLYLILIINTQTRGALVGLVMAITVGGILLAFRKDSKLVVRFSGIGAIAFLVIVAGIIFVNKDSDFVQTKPILSKIASISLTDTTTQSRLATWDAAFKGVADRPLLGWGVENFHQVFNKYFPTVIYRDEGNPLWFDRPHNMLIQYLVEGGVLSLLAFIVFLSILSFYLLRRQKSQYVGILFVGMIIAYIGQNLFVFDSLNSYVPFYLGLSFMLFLITRRDDESAAVTPLPMNIRTALIIVGAIITVGLIWGFNIKAIQANKSFVEKYNAVAFSESPITAEQHHDIMDIVENAPYVGRTELLGAYSEELVSQLQRDALQPSEFVGLVDRVEGLFKANKDAYEHDARFIMFLMNVYLNASRFDPIYAQKLLDESERIIELSPTRPQIYYMTGRTYMRMGEFDKGIAEFQKAADLSPGIYAAQWNLLAAYLQVGEDEKAREKFDTLRSIQNGVFRPTQYQQLAQLFTAAKKFDWAVTSIEEAVELYPDNADMYAGLADLYAAVGRNDDARNAVSRAVELEPGLASQAQGFIELLESGELLRTEQ